MVTKLTKAPSATKKEPITRSFYWLDEVVASKILNPKHYSAMDLLDFAATGQLVMSFAVSSRYVVAGDYEGRDEVFEPPHPDDIYSGLLPLLPDAIWKIISEGSATIEYLFRNEYEFKKLLHDPVIAYPVITTKQLMVAGEDWKRFTGGLSPEPKYPEKVEDPKIIGTLVYLYARATNNPNYFKKDKKTVVVDAVVQQIVGLVTDQHDEKMKGMSSNAVREKIKHALETMQPKILELLKA